MDSNQLASIAGVVLALLFAYVPGLNTWYSGQTSQAKAGIMALAVVVVAAGAFGLACAGLLASLFSGVAVACTEAGALGLVGAVISALLANQTTYLLGVRPFKS